MLIMSAGDRSVSLVARIAVTILLSSAVVTLSACRTDADMPDRAGAGSAEDAYTLFVTAVLQGDEAGAISVTLPPGDMGPVDEIRETYLHKPNPVLDPVTFEVMQKERSRTSGQIDYVLRVTYAESGRLLATVSILVVEQDGRFFIGSIGS